MNDDTLRLSRRKLLAGVSAVGAAGVGAGLGTSALFSDEASFDGNVITAGTLDLIVQYASTFDQGIAGSGSVSGTVDDEAVSAELTDVKPGDSGLLALCPIVDDNPAYLWFCGEVTANDENGLTGPEAAVDDSGGDPGSGNGELAQNVTVAAYYCDVGEIGDEFEPDDVDRLGSGVVFEGTLAEMLSNGFPLDGNAEPVGALGDQACFEGSEGEVVNPCVCIEWEVPIDVGNEIQSDSLAFDLSLYAQQCRHNDGTTNPCCGCGPDEVVLVADGESTCVPVWEGSESVESFYDFGGGSPYATQNPAIQDRETTNLLVYDDGSERYLVVVHDIWNGVMDGSDSTGGKVSATFSGLDPAYSWQVRDDDPGNDSYTTIDSTDESVDWQWAGAYTDGGVIGPLGADFDVGVDLELLSGIETVRYLTETDAHVIAEEVESGDVVGARLSTCD